MWNTSTSGLSDNDTTLVTVIHQNDPPTFTGTIPKIEWPEDNVNSSLNLTQYLSDIDGDDLNYSNSAINNITVNNNTGIVTLTSPLNFYGINHVVFFAYDPDGASNQSNNVTLNVTSD